MHLYARLVPRLHLLSVGSLVATVECDLISRTGEGAACTKCPMNTFKKNFSDTSNECIPCPNGSTAEAGSATHRSCICKPGQLYWKDGDLMLCRTSYHLL